MNQELTIPEHIGYIVDGNRRWAKKHALPAYEGHLAGYEALKDIVIETANLGVKFVSLYTFSTENWKRAEEEVNTLMKLMMRLFKTDLHLLIDEDLKLVVLGSRDGLPQNMNDAIETAIYETRNGKKATVAICFNYGGQQELVYAAQQMMRTDMRPEDVTVETLSQHLYAPEVPACDLVIRTSNEQRLSNFMLWRSAYSEFIFLEKFWPDMRKSDVSAIIEEYNRRQRRFGG